MAKGIDCTTTLSSSTSKALIDSGYSFVCRYLVPESMSWKRITVNEARTISQAGLKIITIFESSASRARGGISAGLADGISAYKEAKLIGQPEGTTIYFAVDYDAPAKDFDIIEDYLRAAANKIPGYYVGVYGSYFVCEAMANRNVCKHFWQTYAWSYGNLSKHANVYQYRNGVSVAGIYCDLNNSFGGEGWWNLSKITVLNYTGMIKVDVDILNVRKDSNSNSDIIATLSKGSILTAVGITSDKAWYKVKINNTFGYVYAQHVSPYVEPILPFKDFNDVSDYAKDAVSKVKELGMMIGDSKGNFNPKVSVTRQDLALVAYRLYQLINTSK